jgi:hypothetical protein
MPSHAIGQDEDAKHRYYVIAAVVRGCDDQHCILIVTTRLAHVGRPTDLEPGLRRWSLWWRLRGRDRAGRTLQPQEVP